jgi:NADH-quinone oxidoreductase subunit L
LWLIGAVTSLLTAIYMFRLVFLTFHGTRRTAQAPADAHGAHGSHAPASHGGHGPGGHGHAPHDAPFSMAMPLVVLAIGSVLAGYIGIPHALGGSNWIERFLHPSFTVEGPGQTTAATTGAAESQQLTPVSAQSAAAETQTEAHTEDVGLERALMGVSVGIAIAGIGIAIFFWLRRPDIPASIARTASGPYRLLLNKYYVDELYDAVIVQPLKQLSTTALWRGVDAGLIDGSVNGVGSAVRGGSGTLRRLQTGSIRTYAAALFVGVVAIVGWYMWTLR